MSAKLNVSGMSCTGCESNVESAVSNIDGVESVEADHEASTVSVEGDFDEAAVREAVEEAGYAVE